MNAVLALFFLILACAVGGCAAWRLPLDRPGHPAGLILIIGLAGLAGALTVAAETGSTVARYLGLVAVLLGSAGFSAAFLAVRRSDRADRRNRRS